MTHPAAIDKTICTGCTQCRLTCPAGAITETDAQCAVDSELCTRCGKCLEVCPLRCIAESQP